MNSRSILWGVITTFLIIGGLWGIWNLMTQSPTSATAEKAVDLNVTPGDHIKGNADAPVTLVEYSDLQCPACRAYAPLVRAILEQNPDTVKLVYRHFPLDQHQNAMVAAYAAEAAGKQDAFFEYHDVLFEKQDEWATMDDPSATFVAYAKELKLDTEQFKKDMDDSSLHEKVEAHRQSGIQYMVNSTPTFFLNGKKIDSPGSLDEFQALIDENMPATDTTMSDDVESTPSAEPDAAEDSTESGDTGSE